MTGFLVGLPLNRPRAGWLALVGLTVVLGGAAVAPRRPAWWGWLPATGGATELATIWGSCLVCSAAAYLASSPRVHGYDDLVRLAKHGPMSTRRLVIAYVGSAGAAGYLLVVLLMLLWPLAVTGRVSGPPLVAAMSVGTTLASAVWWAATGTVIGERLSPMMALPTAVVGPYAAYALGAVYFANQPLGVLALAGAGTFEYSQPSPTEWTVRLLAWIFAGAALVAVILGQRLLSTALWWLTSGSVAATVLVAGPLVEIPGATAASCRDGRPTVCTDHAHASALISLRREAARAASELPLAARPSLVTQDPRLGAHPTRGFEIVVAPSAGGYEPSNIVSRTRFIAQFGDAAFGIPCATRTDWDAEHEAVSSALSIWWRVRNGLPLNGSLFPGEPAFSSPDFAPARAAAARFGGQPGAVRTDWLAEHTAALSRCSSVPVELP